MPILYIGILLIAVLSLILFFVRKEESLSRVERMPQGKVEKYWNGAERRRHLRFDASMSVRYTLKKTRPDEDAVSRDISEGGIRLLVDKKLERGTVLKLQILKNSHDAPISLEGVVAWCNEARDKRGEEEKRLFHIGVKFTRIEKDSRDLFYGMIRSFEDSLERQTAQDGLAISA